MSSDVPDEGDILEGTVARVETYGAFCRLDGRRLQGLIHISQLVADQRVERVEDVLSVDDRVWVKVLKVEMDPNTQRWRIQLSRKDVSQDGMATDLGLERETKEHQRDQLATNLNSMIGMGVALDPMADRLIMKNAAGTGATFRGGYSLVGDDEGEPEVPVVQRRAVVEQSKPNLPPMGRGRGTTLPAWMTQTSDGPTGGGRDEASESDQSDGDGIKKEKKKRERKHSKSHKKRDRKDSSSKGRKRKRHREPDVSDSGSAGNEDDHSDASRGHRDRRRNSKSKKRKSSSRDHRSRHRDDGSESSRETRNRRRRSRSKSSNR
jgi:predicted RNA-binding protein with RPS1 domain